MMRRQRRKGTSPSIVLPFRYRYRRPVLILALGITGTLAAICDRSRYRPVQADDWTRYHDQSFPVVRVVDGDTIDIRIPDGDHAHTRIRLWGVDAPEVGHGEREDMHFGQQAAAFAARALANRSIHVVLSPDRTRGKYGRLLAYVYLERGGRMFNEMLLEDGYAYADLRFKHPYFRQFKEIEKRARREKRGLWADIMLEQMPQWKQRFEQLNSEP